MQHLYLIYFLLFMGCTGMGLGIGGEIFIDYTLWTMREEKHLSEMNCKIIPRMDGFYRKRDNRGGYPNVFYLTQQGYFLFADATYLGIRSRQELASLGEDWGRYMINGDSVEIQYFRNTSGGSKDGFFIYRADLAVSVGKGVILNDNTIMIYKRMSWCSMGCYEHKDISTDIYDPPLEYNFIPCDTLPPSDNWIKHLDYSKSKLDSRWLFW